MLNSPEVLRPAAQRGFVLTTAAPQTSSPKSYRMKSVRDIRVAALAQGVSTARALPNTYLGRGKSRAGSQGSELLLNLRPLTPGPLYVFGLNDSDPRWNPESLDAPGVGFTRYEAENRSWDTVGGQLMVVPADGGSIPVVTPVTLGDILRGINERRATMDRNSFANRETTGS
jgi:hypothetical protein